MLRLALQGARQCGGSVRVSVKRNLGVSAVVAQKAKVDVDPIQQLFLDKIRHYKQQESAGKSPGMTAEAQKELNDQLDRVTQMFNPKGEDFTKLPQFSYTEPTLDPVGVDVQPSVLVAEQIEEVKDEDEDKYFFDA